MRFRLFHLRAPVYFWLSHVFTANSAQFDAMFGTRLVVLLVTLGCGLAADGALGDTALTQDDECQTSDDAFFALGGGVWLGPSARCPPPCYRFFFGGGFPC